MSAVIKASELPEYIRHNERTTKKLRHLPGFPRPRDLTGTGKCLVYLRSEVDAWLAGLPPADVRPEPAQLRAGRLARTTETASAEREAPPA